MAEANLRWRAQTSEAEAQIAALKAVIDSIGSTSTRGKIRAAGSDVDRLGKDGEKAGLAVERGFKKGFRAVEDFGKGLNGPMGVLKPVGLLIQGFGKLTGLFSDGVTAVQDFVKPLEQVGTEGEQAVGMFTSMGASLAPLAGVLGPVVLAFVALGGALFILPAIAAVVAAALSVLLSVLSTLAAVVAGFVAPLTLLGGLLGGLAAAFYLGGKAALTSKTGFDALQHRVEQLGGEFAHFTRDLSHLFLPYFWQLAAAAQTALNYFDKLSKMNLNQAFRSLSSTGVHLLNEFVRGVGNAIADPIRLAIKVAFGRSSNMRNAVQGWWDTLRGYLFGETKRHPIRLDGHVIEFKTTHLQGAIQPLIAWFGRQHFESTGLKWAASIMNGITKTGGVWDHLKPFVIGVAEQAGSAAGHAFAAAFEAEISSLPGMIENAIVGGGGSPTFSNNVTRGHGSGQFSTHP